MAVAYQLNVARPLEVVKALVSAAASGATLSIEGDLSQCHLDRFEGVSREPTEVLARNTLIPRQDFAIVPLTPRNRELLLHSELDRIGIRARVLHLQIEHQGTIRFYAYDSFHPELVWVDDSIPKVIWDRLLAEGAIRELHPANRPAS